MSQNDFTLANQSFPSFRADLNSALQALASNNSGGSAPSTTFANMWWYDSTNNIMYIRNEDNDAWIKFAELDQTNDKFVLSGTLQLDDGTVSAPALTFNSDTNMGIYRGGTDILKFVTAGTDRLTIDAQGSLGVGVVPNTGWSNTWDVAQVGLTGSLCGIASGSLGRTFVSDNAYNDASSQVSTWQYQIADQASQLALIDGKLEFRVATAGSADADITWNQAVIVDNSGNLLVSKTSTGFGTAGVELSQNGVAGKVFMTRSGGESLSLNRLSSDGEIVGFYKNSTLVGAIGTSNGDLYIGTGDTGLRFHDGDNSIYSVNATTGAKINGAIDLGEPAGRFKDLYLSSGVNIKGSTPKITLEHSNENGTAQIYTTAQSAIILDADPDNTDNGTPIAFKVDGSEVGRFDDGGNLLVGTTNANPAENNVAGIGALANNTLSITRDGNVAMQLNRKTSDGSIAIFRKDGSSVGAISTFSNTLQIGSYVGNDAFIQFVSSGIKPVNSAGTNRDNGIDLGASNARFKDLYLGGGVYLGGTGSANKLDDYEEGSLSLSVATGTASFSFARYTKVGNLVTIRFNISIISDQSSTSNLLVTGLPFTSTANNQSASGILSRYFSGGGDAYIAYISASQTQVQFFQTVNNGNYHQVRHVDLTNANANAFVTISYETT